MTTTDELFKLDEFRGSLLKRNQVIKFKDTYKKKVKVVNTNTPDIWREKILKGYSDYYPMKDDRISIVSDMVTMDKGMVLNIGVGDGDLEKKLNDKEIYTSIGMDITIDGLSMALKTSKFIPVCGQIQKLPFKPTFGTICVLEVLEHLIYTEILEVLSNLRSLLIKGGELIISVPINETYSSEFNPNHHMRRYSIEVISAELEMIGLTILQIQTLYAFRRFYRLKNFLARKIMTGRWQPNVVIIKAVKP